MTRKMIVRMIVAAALGALCAVGISYAMIAAMT